MAFCQSPDKSNPWCQLHNYVYLYYGGFSSHFIRFSLRLSAPSLVFIEAVSLYISSDGSLRLLASSLMFIVAVYLYISSDGSMRLLASSLMFIVEVYLYILSDGVKRLLASSLLFIVAVSLYISSDAVWDCQPDCRHNHSYDTCKVFLLCES